MPKFGIAEAQLVALFMESAAWGVQTVTVTICIYTLVGTSRKLKRPINVSLVAYALVLFGLGTLDIAFAVYRNIQAFIHYEGEGGAAAIFSQLSDYVTVLRVGTTRDYICSTNVHLRDVPCQNGWKLLATLVADSALVSSSCNHCIDYYNISWAYIYRCWVIYGRKLAYVTPSALLWMACFATAAVDTYYTSTLKEATGVTGAKKVENFFNLFLVCKVVLNIITTGEPVAVIDLTSFSHVGSYSFIKLPLVTSQAPPEVLFLAADFNGPNSVASSSNRRWYIH